MNLIHFLGLHVQPGGIVSEKYLPPPAMGNMKPDSPDYAKKYAEKQAKAAEDASSDPVLAIPGRVTMRMIYAQPDAEQCFAEIPEMKSETISLAWGKDGAEVGKFLIGRATPLIVFGLHPTTHVRMLVNSWLRLGGRIPACLRQGSYIAYNPWRELGGALEYPEAAAVLGLDTQDPIAASWALVSRLGVPTSCLIP